MTLPLVVLCHELGHALAAIWYSRKPVTVFLGSYGNEEMSWKLSLGILTVWIGRNPFSFKGLCVPSSVYIPIRQQIIYTVAGPIASLFFALIATSLTFVLDAHGALKMFFVLFIISSILDLYVNLKPDPTPLYLHYNHIVYNDGYALKKLFMRRKWEKEWDKATEMFSKEAYSDAAEIMEQIIKQGYLGEDVFRITLNCYWYSQNYAAAKKILLQYPSHNKLQPDELIQAGWIFFQLKEYKTALEYQKKAVQFFPSDPSLLNNTGYILSILEEYEEAITLLDRTIELLPDFAYAYNNRGFCKIKLGYIKEGGADIQQALSLDPFNAYGYRNWAVYHLAKGNSAEAKVFLEKAQELDPSTPLLSELMEQANS